ncbi:MAG: transporter permease [Bacillales bacterium]|jgi:simple sugar transport system permease protein|nr:transporter permease [Bacillales bacterium]
MEFLTHDFIPYFILAVGYGIPILYGTLGGILAEKAGNINLGIEGMMLMGAAAGFLVSLSTENVIYGLLAAVLAGGFGALIYAFLTVSLKANQIVTGLALTIFGAGMTKFLLNLNKEVVRIPNSVQKSLKPILSDVLGIEGLEHSIFKIFDLSILVYLAFLIAIVLHFYLNHTRYGLNLRAVGENLAAADAAGINVNLYKYVHVVLGGALCGLGGAYLSMYYIPIKTEDVVHGNGWIAVALVIFVSWKPLRAIIGSLLFGALSLLGKSLQTGVSLSPYLLDMLPFIVTILVLIITSVQMSKENAQPRSCGLNFDREER